MAGRVLHTIAAISAAASFSLGCVSPVVMLAPEPPEEYEVLGDAEGKACGHLLITSSSLYNFLPIGMDTKLERAHAAALASVPGATGLVNVIVSDSYVFYLLGNAHCVEIQGHAIR
jgi:hypothetical protein